MRTEWITCNTCGADDYRKLSMVGDWTIGECASCGLIYVNPMPFFEPTSEFSEMSREFQYTRYMHQTITSEILTHEKQQLLGHLRQIADLNGQEFSAIRYLEIGCGSGASVQAATELGWEATGIDIDPELIHSGRKQFDVDLRCAPLLESGLTEGSFHFIRLRDVIEHLPNPYESLQMINRLLVPGGIALFATPNEEGLPTRVRLMFGKNRDKVATVPPPHHLHGFTPETLRRLFERTGFDPLEIKTILPVDPAYVTSNNLRSARNPVFVGVWKIGQMVGKGSMLIGWAGKPFSTEPCGAEQVNRT